MGPSRTPNINEYQLFVIFADDYSCITWLLLLKHRSEYVISKFCNEIFTQFDNRIKVTILIMLWNICSPWLTPPVSIIGLFIQLVVLTLFNRMASLNTSNPLLRYLESNYFFRCG